MFGNVVGRGKKVHIYIFYTNINPIRIFRHVNNIAEWVLSLQYKYLCILNTHI